MKRLSNTTLSIHSNAFENIALEKEAIFSLGDELTKIRTWMRNCSPSFVMYLILHVLILGHETVVCAVCLSILMNLWYGWVVSWDIRVLVVFAPNVTDMQLYYHARYPTDDWHLAYMFSLVYFFVEVCLVGVFLHSASTWRDPCVRVYVPLTLPPPSRENKIEGVTRLCTWAKRGGIWTDASVCLHFGWKSGLLDSLISPYLAQS